LNDKNKQKLGNQGENLAAEYLTGRGVAMIGRNVRTKYGELDLIGNCNGMTVVFEVKTRRTETYGFPEEAISQMKRKHLIASAEAYMQEHPELPNEWRIDVIAISLKSNKIPEIEWFENAVS
jgi:putative endonuclease